MQITIRYVSFCGTAAIERRRGEEGVEGEEKEGRWTGGGERRGNIEQKRTS